MAALGWLLNLNFAAGAVDAPAVTPSAPQGGGRGRRRRRRGRYPRRVYIEGEVYVARSPNEELAILEQHLREVESEALELALTDAPKQEVARAKVRVVRAARRVDQVAEREDDWIEQLLAEDEEILTVLLH
jgi:hypothetical protein